MVEINALCKETGVSADKITFCQLNVTATVDVKDKDLVSLHGDICWSFKGKAILYVYEEIVLNNDLSFVYKQPQSDVVNFLLGASIQFPC